MITILQIITMVMANSVHYVLSTVLIALHILIHLTLTKTLLEAGIIITPTFQVRKLRARSWVACSQDHQGDREVAETGENGFKRCFQGNVW